MSDQAKRTRVPKSQPTEPTKPTITPPPKLRRRRWYHRALRAVLPKAVLQTLAHPTAFTATAASAQIVASGARVLLGCALCEAAGTPAAAKARLRNGTSVTAPVLIPVTFAASGSMDTFFPDEGVEVTNGAIFLEVVSGTVEGVVYWG